MQAPSVWISRFAKLAPKGGQVLDLACGSGRHCDYFLDLGHPVTALDRDVGKLTPRDRLEIIQHDLEGGGPWPLENRQFSAVVVGNFLFRPNYEIFKNRIFWKFLTTFTKLTTNVPDVLTSW